MSSILTGSTIFNRGTTVADKLNIGIIIGSVREGRVSLPLAQWIAEEAAKYSAFEPALVDLAEWVLPHFALPKPPAMGGYADPVQILWAAEVGRYDGYVFVTPEYNRGIPGVLKNAVDYVYAEWARKPAAIVSHGSLGGLGAAQALRATLAAINMAPLGPATYIQGAGGKLADGRYQGDARDAKALGGMLNELAWWAAALKAARS